MTESVQMSLGDFAPSLDSALSQYHTPVKLARKIVKWAKIDSTTIALEPSAGGGNIVRELIRVNATVEAVEIDPRWVKVLRHEFSATAIIDANFLEWMPSSRYHMAIMNPPLDEGVGTYHVKHALRFAPRVISILRGQDLHCKERYRNLWSDCDLAGLALLVQRPVYCGKGGQIETIVVDVRRKGTFKGRQTIEHWSDSWI